MLLLNTTGLATLILSIKNRFIKKNEIISAAPTIVNVKSSNKSITIDKLEMGNYVVVEGEINELTINKLVEGEYSKGKESVSCVQFVPDPNNTLEEQYKISIKGNVVWNLDQTNNVKPGSNMCKIEIRLVDGVYYKKLINYK